MVTGHAAPPSIGSNHIIGMGGLLTNGSVILILTDERTAIGCCLRAR
jgi:hypothetical protein